MVKVKKVPRKKTGSVKRPAEAATVNIGGHDIEIAPRSLAERVADVLRDAGEGGLTAEEIASRLTGDWTLADLEAELARAVDLCEIGCSSLTPELNSTGSCAARTARVRRDLLSASSPRKRRRSAVCDRESCVLRSAQR